MRFLAFFVAVLVASSSLSFSQDKKERDRPRLFQGGLIKRFEDLQEKLRKDREERIKKREEDAKKLKERFEDQLRADKKRSDQRRADSRRNDPINRSTDLNRSRDPYAPSRNSLQPNSSRRNPNLPTNPTPITPEAINSSADAKVSLGVEVKSAGLATAGLIVKQVSRSGPAAAAGVQVDDRIVSVGGSTIKNIQDLDLIMSAFEPGDRTEIEIMRKSKKKKMLVDFPGSPASSTARPNSLGRNSARNTEELPGPENTPKGSTPPILPSLEGPNNQLSRNRNVGNSNLNAKDLVAGIGVTAVAVDPVLYARQNLSVRQGAYLEEIQKGSAAEKAGLKQGDVVIAVDGRKVDSAMTMADLIQTYQPKEKAQLLYYRQNRLKRTEIQMDGVSASQLNRLAVQSNPNQNRSSQGLSSQSTPSRQNSILGDLGKEFPRLKKVENLIDRFSVNPREDRNSPARNFSDRNSRTPSTGQAREAALENEVQLLRNRLRGQDQQIKDLTEKLTLIEKLLSERQADKSRNNNNK